MPRFTIKSADGTLNRYTGAPTYHGTHLKASYIEFPQVASPIPIPWEVGDYVDYTRTGFRYRLYAIPQPEKSAVPLSAGDAFVYHDVQLYCATKDLEIAPFRDLVISDNKVHFTTMPDVATYEDVFGIARRIQANVDSFYGEGEWVIKVFDTSDPDLRAILLETKEFSLSDGTCLDALAKIYELWKGIGWVYSVENGVNTITIGRANVQDRNNTTSVFAYGVGNGIKVLKREQSGRNDLATRLYAYGSTRNMIARYYNNVTPAIKDAESVYIPNLMIPIAHWGQTDGKSDPRKAFLQADNDIVARYGLRPKTIYFDGNGDYEEIFPSIETMTAGQVRAAMQPTDDYYPSTDFYPDFMRVDGVSSAVNPDDNGVLSNEGGGKYAQSVSVLGVTYTATYNLSVGQDSTKTYLDDISIANTITATGKVHVDTALSGYISCDASLATLTVKFWIEIGGVKYGERDATIVRGKNGVFNISLQPFDIITENTGTVMLKGYVASTRNEAERSAQMGVNLNPGTTTLSVEFTPSQTFEVHIPQVGFDISKQQSSVSGGICTISFKSGWCAGRDFTVKKCEYVEASDRWRLTVIRQKDDGIGQYFPNSEYRIEAGDRFVLIDLSMPDIYHTAAEQRLYNRASEVIGALSTPKYVYEPEIDAKVLAKSPEKILEGMYMPIQDTNVVGEDKEFVLIDSVEIDEASESIPTYRITLQDEKRENFFARLTKESGRNTRNITEITLRDLRNEVEELTPSITQDGEISVRVVASHPIIGYKNSFEEDPVNTVVLTCETSGIDSPTYQWYFRGAISWVPIPGATGQSYTVEPDGELYYLNGEVAEDFRCVVSDDEGLSAVVQIMKVLSNAVTVSLSNPAHIFRAGEEYAVAATDRSDVLGYRGVERIATNVKQGAIRFLRMDGTVIPTTYAGGRLLEGTGKYLTDSDGKYLLVAGSGGAAIYNGSNLMMSVQVEGNNTTGTYLSISVTDKMNIPVGKIEIPIVIQDAEGDEPERIVNLYYSWALALKGESPLIADITNEADGVAVGSNELLETTVTLSTTVFLYYGTNAEDIATAVATVPPAYSGKITANTVINTGGKSATITFTLTASAASPIDFTGVNAVEIPISVTGARGSRTVTYSLLPIAEGEDGAVFVLRPDYDVIKGTRGDDGTTITYDHDAVGCTRYMRKGSGELSTTTTGYLRYSVDGGTTKSDYSSAVPVSSAVSSGGIIFYWYLDNAYTKLIDRETVPIVVDGAKGEPGRDGQDGQDGQDGADGVSASTVYLYKRSSSGAPTIGPNVDLTYTFATGALTPKDSGGAETYGGGWSKEIPTGDDPCYVTMAFVQDSAATKVIKAGYNTAATPGDWSPATRLTGDNGLMGKVMRGINEYSPYGLGTQSNPVDYQGLRDTDTSHVYYDMVYVESGTRTYYYCQNEKKGNTYAREITPGSESDSDTTVRCWVAATHFDFVATRVLLASNAFIDILSGNALYMYDNGQEYIVAGVQGGSTTTSGVQTVSQVNFFAGTHPETSAGAGDAVTPLNAPFRVTYDGVVYCKDIRISGGEIQISNGNAVVFSVSNTGALVAQNSEINGSIEASGNNFPVTDDSEGRTVAIKSNNGLWVTSGYTFLSTLITEGVAYFRRDILVDNGTIHATTSASSREHYLTASDGTKTGEVWVGNTTGRAKLTASDATHSVILDLLLGDALLNRNNGGDEHIVSSGNFKHVTVCNHNAVPQPGDPDYDAYTLYLEKKS